MLHKLDQLAKVHSMSLEDLQLFCIDNKFTYSPNLDKDSLVSLISKRISDDSSRLFANITPIEAEQALTYAILRFYNTSLYIRKGSISIEQCSNDVIYVLDHSNTLHKISMDNLVQNIKLLTKTNIKYFIFYDTSSHVIYSNILKDICTNPENYSPMEFINIKQRQLALLQDKLLNLIN